MEHDNDMGHLEHIQAVLDEDAQGLFAAETNYRGSWKKRGGVSAYFMLCRKWDRIQNRLEQVKTVAGTYPIQALRYELEELKLARRDRVNGGDGRITEEKLDQIIEAIEANLVPRFDIFAAIEADERAEGLIDDIRDLRRYLVLVEAEMRARGASSAVSTHRDNMAQAQREAFVPASKK